MPNPTNPIDVPTWATTAAAPADIDEPPQPTQDAGWPALIPPPHEWFNWWMNRVGVWVEFLNQTSRMYGSLQEATEYARANLSTGDRVWVFRDDNDNGPGVSDAVIATGVITTAHLGGVDSSGDHVAYCFGNSDAHGIDRTLTLGSRINYVRTNAGENAVIKTDGITTVLAYGQYVEAFSVATQASLWVHDNDVLVADLCISAGFVYIVHALTAGTGDATANRQAHKLNLTTGAVVWSFRHSNAGGDLRACCTNGRQLFVTGAASDYPSGANLRAIVTSDGFDATGEGNNGDDLSGLAWNQTLTTPSGKNATMDCDGTMLYLGLPLTVANQIEARAQVNGVLVWGVPQTDGALEGRSVSVDTDFVMVCYVATVSPPEVGVMIAHDKRNGAAAWQYATESGGALAAGAACSSDSQAVFWLGDDEDRNLRRITRGNTRQAYRLIDPAIELVRYGNMQLQPEAQ